MGWDRFGSVIWAMGLEKESSTWDGHSSIHERRIENMGRAGEDFLTTYVHTRTRKRYYEDKD